MMPIARGEKQKSRNGTAMAVQSACQDNPGQYTSGILLFRVPARQAGELPCDVGHFAGAPDFGKLQTTFAFRRFVLQGEGKGCALPGVARCPQTATV
jgi:hypothetical protein